MFYVPRSWLLCAVSLLPGLLTPCHSTSCSSLSGHLQFQTLLPPTLTQAQHLSGSIMFPPALPQSHPYKNCKSGRWEKAPSWISEKAAFTRVLQGTHESILCKCLKDLFWAQRWTGQWLLLLAAQAPTCIFLYFPNSMLSFTILCCCLQGHQRPQAHLPSQPTAGSITITITITINNTRIVLELLRDGKQDEGPAASLVLQARDGRSWASCYK